ncbi:hypothetical protein OAK45_02545 [Verrucomicrobia bacterium]|nr:hypothetical protein [Verrucomicrobiota bacterium]
MKKILKSRWFVALLGGVLFIATLVGLTLKSKDLLLQSAVEQSDKIKEAKEKKEVEIAEEAEKPKTMVDTAKTEESEEHKAKQAEDNRIIERRFGDLNNITAAGDLEITDPGLRDLIQRLQARGKYLEQREAELEELNSHISEQLKELHFHTNHISTTRAHLDKLFEGKVIQIQQSETNKLMRLAGIYENIMNQGDAEVREANLRNLIRATQDDDPTLNPKIFQYMAPTNQATIVSTLISGDAEDIKLYNTLIKEWRRTMPNTGSAPLFTP